MYLRNLPLILQTTDAVSYRTILFFFTSNDGSTSLLAKQNEIGLTVATRDLTEPLSPPETFVLAYSPAITKPRVKMLFHTKFALIKWCLIHFCCILEDIISNSGVWNLQEHIHIVMFCFQTGKWFKGLKNTLSRRDAFPFEDFFVVVICLACMRWIFQSWYLHVFLLYFCFILC